MNNINTKYQILNNKGITLVALIVSIVIMLILAGVSIGSSMESIDDTKLKGFYTKLEIVQKRVDEVTATNESYIDENGNTINIRETGVAYEDLDEGKKSVLNSIINQKNLNVQPENFRYFTSEDLESIFDLSEIDYNVFIEFDNRIVIASEGIEINGEKYYMLENNMYFPKYSNEGNPTLNAEIPLSYTVVEYGTDKYKVTITPNSENEEYKPTTVEIKYKKTSSKYWETSTNFEIIMDKTSDYDITYEDSYKNIVNKKIKVTTDEENNLTVTEITEENN